MKRLMWLAMRPLPALAGGGPTTSTRPSPSRISRYTPPGRKAPAIRTAPRPRYAPSGPGQTLFFSELTRGASLLLPLRLECPCASAYSRTSRSASRPMTRRWLQDEAGRLEPACSPDFVGVSGPHRRASVVELLRRQRRGTDGEETGADETAPALLFQAHEQLSCASAFGRAPPLRRIRERRSGLAADGSQWRRVEAGQPELPCSSRISSGVNGAGLGRAVGWDLQCRRGDREGGPSEGRPAEVRPSEVSRRR